LRLTLRSVALSLDTLAPWNMKQLNIVSLVVVGLETAATMAIGVVQGATNGLMRRSLHDFHRIVIAEDWRT